jgi:hypothetical protein
MRMTERARNLEPNTSVFPVSFSGSTRVANCIEFSGGLR